MSDNTHPQAVNPGAADNAAAAIALPPPTIMVQYRPFNSSFMCCGGQPRRREKFTVLIDDVVVGTLLQGDKKTFTVTPGLREIGGTVEKVAGEEYGVSVTNRITPVLQSVKNGDAVELKLVWRSDDWLHFE